MNKTLTKYQKILLMQLINIILIVAITIFSPISANSQCPNKKCSTCEDTSICGKNEPKSAAAKLAKQIEAQNDNNINKNNTNENEDEFLEYNSDNTGAEVSSSELKDEIKAEKPFYTRKLFFPIVSLIMTALAGIFIRFPKTRKLRGVFLALSVIFLGFYVGACPCPISSFSFTIIGLSGGEFDWENSLWFLGLIPLTFVFHKTWCGWVCHLGALQEFLFMKSNKLEFLKSARTQKVLKITRYVLVLALILQLIITHTYMFNQVDPFRVAYNLGYNAGYIEWILLALLVISSIFMYRPFCKAACPIGLVLGWVSKIPGAAVLDKNNKCISCSICASSCEHQAIYRKENISIIDNKECIACGECMIGCKKSGIEIFRHNKNHKTVNQISKDKI